MSGCENCPTCRMQAAFGTAIERFLTERKEEGACLASTANALIAVLVDELASEVIIFVQEGRDPAARFARCLESLPAEVRRTLEAKAAEHAPALLAKPH